VMFDTRSNSFNLTKCSVHRVG